MEGLIGKAGRFYKATSPYPGGIRSRDSWAPISSVAGRDDATRPRRQGIKSVMKHKPNLLVLICHEMGNKFVGQLKETGWLDYAIFFLHFGHTEICRWVTNLLPSSCQIRTKRLCYIYLCGKPAVCKYVPGLPDFSWCKMVKYIC
jgi:hypothetical protein